MVLFDSNKIPLSVRDILKRPSCARKSSTENPRFLPKRFHKPIVSHNSHCRQKSARVEHVKPIALERIFLTKLEHFGLVHRYQISLLVRLLLSIVGNNNKNSLLSVDIKS